MGGKGGAGIAKSDSPVLKSRREPALYPGSTLVKQEELLVKRRLQALLEILCLEPLRHFANLGVP